MTNPHPFYRRARIALAPVAAALIVAGCATGPTPYQPLGARGATGGFTEQRLEANRYRVAFVGNQFTSRARVENYLLFRAAELTLANGFDSFTIVRRDTEREVETRVSPGIGAYPYWRPYWSYWGRPFGRRYWDPWYGDPFWADRVDVRTVDRYEATAEIVMFRGSRPNDAMSFDARQVIANLRPTLVVPR